MIESRPARGGGAAADGEGVGGRTARRRPSLQRRAASRSSEDYSVFFFSSRRRHTRFDCDWSSDVCSSDLCSPRAEDTERGEQRALPLTLAVLIVAFGALVAAALPVLVGVLAITIALGLVTKIGRASCRERV